MKFFTDAKILTHKNLENDTYALELQAPEIAAQAKPGQFVMMYLDKGELLLPRPISICNVNETKTAITLVYITVGAGTKTMSQWPVEHTVKLLGPIGNGFSFSTIPDKGTVALVGGGLGVPPLLFLLKELVHKGIQADVYMGFRQKSALVRYFENNIPIGQALESGDEGPYSIYVATDDGSQGQKGTVMDILQPKQYDTIFSCGPIPMLKALSQYASTKGIPCQVSVEERMACGLGACKGCVVKTLVGYQLCCEDGPVFDSQEVNFG